MNPPYEITPLILQLATSITRKIGELNSGYQARPQIVLRKRNTIKTIYASLKIEGNLLSEEQVTAIIDGKRVMGRQQDILEVQNAINIYEAINSFQPASLKSLFSAHKLLMDGLIDSAGKFRNHNVGVFSGSTVVHMAPPFGRVPGLMDDLFRYLQNRDELTLIKACVFHYEFEFIHPFADGNGRIGRLWQSLILMQEYPVFESLPLEMIVSELQQEYYDALKESGKLGNSTPFIEYMLRVIDISLGELLESRNGSLTVEERLEYFLYGQKDEFTRRDYLKLFRGISTATASRDLATGVETGVIKKTGSYNQTRYRKV